LRSGGSLPADLTSLVGRVREVRDVRAMLGRARLVSLTGPGGVGKTRVALAAARTAERAFADGVWFIDLAGLRDPALVEATVTATLGEDNSRGSRALAEYIADWQALLLLDNCEHLLASCAGLVRDVLQSAPDVRVLATSREPIGLSGEHVLRIGPLQVPAETSAVSPGTLLGSYESVQLLVDRAQAIQHDFAVTPANAADVARLCRRLDGLPLTIELAAARLNTMSIRQIADRLDDQNALLRGGPRDAPRRQVGLEETVTWSYELCTAGEQQLWARMSVFAAPVDADAVEQICGGGEVDDVLELLDGLVRKSIVVCEQGELPRFSLLAAIKQYGRRRLDLQTEMELTARHAAYYEQITLSAAEDWTSRNQLVHAERLRNALPDLRLALDHFLLRQPARGAGMVAALYMLWLCHGWFSEGNLWLDRALAGTSPTDPEHAAGLMVQGWVHLVEGKIAASRPKLERAVELANKHELAQVRDYGQALLAVAEGFEGRPEAGVGPCRAAMDRRRAAGDPGAVGLFLVFLAEMYCTAGDFEQALQCSDEAERICAALGETWCRSWAMSIGSLACCAQGDYHRAAESARSAVELKVALEDSAGILVAAEVLSWTMAAAGRWDDAGRLHAAVQPRGDRLASPLADFRFLSTQRAAWGAKIREHLGPEAYAAAEREGAAIGLEDIGQFALAPPADRNHGTAGPRDPARGPLTRRETEVAALVAEGLSNRDIAARLVISPRTAEVHVERILVKLGFRSRAQVAPWWADGT